MRAVALTVVALVACGGGAGKPATSVPEPPKGPPPQAIDVTSVEEPGPGFRFASTVHRSGGGSKLHFGEHGGVSGTFTTDFSYTLEILPANAVRIDFGAGTFTQDSVEHELVVANRSYLLSTDAPTHADGSPISDDETAVLQEFYTNGGLAIPGRNALAGQRLDKDQTKPLTAQELAELTGQVVANDAVKGTLILRGVDASGIATIDLTGDFVSPDKATKWSMKGTLLIDATTLLPASLTLDLEVSLVEADGMMSADQSSTQTFTYP